MKNRNTNPD